MFYNFINIFVLVLSISKLISASDDLEHEKLMRLASGGMIRIQSVENNKFLDVNADDKKIYMIKENLGAYQLWNLERCETQVRLNNTNPFIFDLKVFKIKSFISEFFITSNDTSVEKSRTGEEYWNIIVADKKKNYFNIQSIKNQLFISSETIINTVENNGITLSTSDDKLYMSNENNNNKSLWKISFYIITSDSLENIIRNYYTRTTFDLFSVDKKYHLLTIDEVNKVYIDSNLNTQYRYKSEKFDCDDFAICLKAEVSKWMYTKDLTSKDGSEITAGAAFGIIFGENTEGRHAYNFFITPNLEIKIIEPQNGSYILLNKYRPFKIII